MNLLSVRIISLIRPKVMMTPPEEPGIIPLSSSCLASALLLGLATFGDFLTFVIGMVVVRNAVIFIFANRGF